VAFILTLGDDMIAVGRYDRIEGDHAEVSFLIEDAHQGRGIAQLLLEHLAQAARERGITRFVAEVLPENRRMAKVFADAGYRVSKGIEDGVLAVEFPILPTDTSVGVMERREHRAESVSMQRLLTPQRIAVYGRGDRVKGLISSMLGGGFRGEVTAVTTDGSEVAGVTNAASLAALPGRLDLAIVSVPTNQLGAVVIDAACWRSRDVLPVSGCRRRPAQPRHTARGWSVVLHQHRRLRRRHRQRRDAVLGGRRGNPGLSAHIGFHWQPQKVLSDHSAVGWQEARRRL
jgi:GNAT superfamily N-acetyltransferase